MLSIIKNLFVTKKDYAGRDIEAVIIRLASQSGTHVHAWSYLTELSVYENTVNGMRVYPHETAKHAA